MKINVLGTGVVGQTIATKMLELGHEVSMGTRNAQQTKSRADKNHMSNQSFSDWHADHSKVNLQDYENLPTNCDLYINATSGGSSLDALNALGKDNLRSKIILDIANPLDFSKGMPPSLSVCNTDSLAEQIQRSFPDSKVVKSLNTMNCFLMMNPLLVKGDHSVFISGNDTSAKNTVKILLESIGWSSKNIIDLGDITTARATEMLLPIWLRLWGALGSAEFNFHIQKA